MRATLVAAGPPSGIEAEVTRRERSYDDYVEHARFGRGPRFTGLCIDERDDDTYIGFLGGIEGVSLIQGTAIEADLEKQVPATFAVTHYLDLETVCRDCEKRFIFFAEEQKHWYEELQFDLASYAVRCQPCRHAQHEIEVLRTRYQTLLGLSEPSGEQCLELAETHLTLVERGEFSKKHLPRVRGALNRAEKELGPLPTIVAARGRCAHLESEE